jgi:hypothetical protein
MIELSGPLSNMQLGLSVCAMPECSAQNDVCSLDDFLVIYGLNSANSTDNTRFELMSNHTERRLSACFAAVLHLGGTSASLRGNGSIHSDTQLT